MPAGEMYKTREQWAQLTDELLALGGGRDTTIVALGGGVVGDVAGFVAATYMRGVPVVQVPTTLLAMIDASIGGKTGVDGPEGKNLVGAFHDPAAVAIDPLALASLPAVELRAGSAEAIKHGAVADAGYFDWLAEELPGLLSRPDDDRWPELIARSVEIKADVVTRDARERGLRKILNFGHTIGHAIEAAAGFRLLHGEAVAIGMTFEAAIAERVGIAQAGTAAAIRAAARRAGLPTALPRHLAPLDILRRIRFDKKGRRGVVEYALPSRVGEMAGTNCGWAVGVDDEIVRAELEGGV